VDPGAKAALGARDALQAAAHGGGARELQRGREARDGGGGGRAGLAEGDEGQAEEAGDPGGEAELVVVVGGVAVGAGGG
jgi:hypothetical protein